MAKRLTNEEQNLRRKARRRLIGAIALTLVVVVVLPMVLDSEPRPTGQDIELRIPDPDKAGAFIPGAPVSELADRKATIPSEVVPPTSTAKGASGSDIATAVPGKAKAVVNKPVKSKVADKPAAADSESYVVQVGAYSNADTAKQEFNKLKQWGFKAYTEKAGDTIRVRVGPYADREKAEKARQLLEKHGLQPVIMSAK